MKKIIAFFLCINIVCSAASRLGYAELDGDECALAKTLSDWLEIEVTTDGLNLRFSGAKDKLEAAVVKLRDFDQIRREFLPISKEAGTTRSILEPLGSWEECFAVLGISQASVLLFNLQGTTDEAGTQLMIPAGDDFNSHVAKLYIDTITKNSVFFKWIVDNFKDQFIESVETAEGRFLAIRYGLLNQFLCLGNIAITEEVEGKHDGDDAHVQNADCVIPKQSILRTLVAAGSGAISLERRSGNEYGVRFVSIGEGAGGSYPTVEFVLDTSGSMHEKIYVINQTMPKLLEQLQSRFSKIRIRIFSFNDAKQLVTEYDLLQGQQIPAFGKLYASGGTNLGHIASSITLKDDEQSKAVVAFTDGCHESSPKSLSEALDLLKTSALKGKVALPRLFRVGAGSCASEKFFRDMSGIVAGFSAYSDSIDDFCGCLLRDITEISRPRTALSLQREGITISMNWVPIDRPGLFKTVAKVKYGDSIVERHGSHLVTFPHDAEEPQIAALVLDAKAAKRAERERLLAALAALGDDE